MQMNCRIARPILKPARVASEGPGAATAARDHVRRDRGEGLIDRRRLRGAPRPRRPCNPASKQDPIERVSGARANRPPATPHTTPGNVSLSARATGCRTALPTRLLGGPELLYQQLDEPPRGDRRTPGHVLAMVQVLQVLADGVAEMPARRLTQSDPRAEQG